MPHVTIKHFPADLSAEQQQTLSTALTRAVIDAFGVPESVVSIALEPVRADLWHEQVYQPEIAGRESLLKQPGY